MRLVEINGIWVIEFSDGIQISGGKKEDLQRLMDSFSDETDDAIPIEEIKKAPYYVEWDKDMEWKIPIPNCSYCDFSPCRCKNKDYER
jgi:hypothetical protein